MVLRHMCLLLLLELSFACSAQTADTVFKKEWVEIDTLIVKKDLTKTALEKVKRVYQLAKQRQLPDQVLKSLIYQYSLEERITENDPNRIIKSLQAEIIATTDEVQKAVLYSFLAKQYRLYYNNHRWNFYGRKATVNFIKTDVATWGNDDFVTAITANYLLSLKNPVALQQKNIESYDAVIIKGNSRKLRPTLFDLLGHEALDYFTAGDMYNTKPVNAFVIDDKNTLKPLETFIPSRFVTKDSSSLQWIALRIYQQLLSFHSKDSDKDVLVKLDLERIEWVYQQAVFVEKDLVYQTTLENICHQFSSTPFSARAWYLLARTEADKARNYQPFEDTSNRYSYTKAAELIEKALPLYKESNTGYIDMQNLLSEITSKHLLTQTEKVNVPNKPFRALVTYRNTDTLFGRIIRIDNNDWIHNSQGKDKYWKTVSNLPVYKSFTQLLPANTDHQTHSSEIKIDELPVGEYALLSSTGKGFTDSLNKMCVQFFYVSNISYIKNNTDFFVLNREDGKPIVNAKVTIIRQNTNDTIATRSTDKNGYFKFEPKQNMRYGNLGYLFSTQNDRLLFRNDDRTYFINDDANESTPKQFEKDNTRIFYFTDRSIYRPGQPVFFKGIAVTKDFTTKTSRIISSKDSGWVYLKDVNGKRVDSMRFGINTYGSFNGKFQLPQNTLTGEFSISASIYDQGSAEFSVEEYKRPKFNVGFEKVKGAYRLNDTIVITGSAKAFSGNMIDDAKVSFNIKRNTRYLDSWSWRRPSPQGNREISHGETRTDTEGKFTIKFKAEAGDMMDRSGNPLFDFTIEADITDINGETHSASTSVTVGFSSLLVELSFPSITEADSLKSIRIITTNLSNEKEPAKVQVKIYSVQAPERLIRKRYWERPDQFVLTEKEFINYFPTDEYDNETNSLTWARGQAVAGGELNTADTNLFLLPSGTLNAGYYKIEATTKDKYGEEVKQTSYTRLFSRKENQMPFADYQFNYTLDNQVEPGETATFLTGTSANNVFVISKTEKLNQKDPGYVFINREKGMQTIRYTPDEKDRGGVSITEAYVFNNRVYTHQYAITVPWTNKFLQVSYSTYRNKTEPGAIEKWAIDIQGSKGEKVSAELLTAMSDASLDEFKTHDWSIPNLWESNNVKTYFNGTVDFTISNSFENYIQKGFSRYSRDVFDHLANNGMELWGGVYSNPNMIRIRGLASANQNKAAYRDNDKLESVANGLMLSESVVVTKFTPPKIIKEEEDKAGQQKTKNQNEYNAPVIRKNFNETAFFFPNLYADTSGKYSFSFTMPEALTQWKWMSLAHTKDLAFGVNSDNIITQKKLMVQPNAPRFMREGDNMEFSSKIVNLTEKEITGQVTLELFDAAANTSVDGWFQNIFPSQYFTIEAGQSFAVKFPIQVPFSFNRPLTWRIVAKAGEFSDGEENTLPVLTNRMLVTESLPLFLPNDTTQHFVFDKLLHNTSESLTQEALTVEYSSNPVWYAVQALPYLMEYPYECAEQTFNRFYANALASYIVNKQPGIKKVFEQWKADTASLQSNLQKNEELKQILLQETPWVLDAQNEAQQKKNISLLFDLVKLSNQTDALIEKLSQLQLPNGSFSWFKGGYEDRYMTNYILTGIGKLKRLGAMSPEIASRIRIILVNALKYMDSKISEDYYWLVKNKVDMSKQQLSTTHIEYLYMRSFFRDIAQQSPVPYDYFFKQGKQYWINQNSYYKAELGLIYYRNSDEKFAVNTILPALLENTVTDTKQGMYWKSAYAGRWYQSPIEHQSMMIAFMSEINTNQSNTSLTKNINAMKTWLLLNKQTTNWKTTIATADACYALLLNGTDWLSAEKKVNIQLGKYTINSSNEKTEAGTGYFKKRIEGSQVNSEMGNIIITTSTNQSTSQPINQSTSQPSWGSVYWQYFEDLDKITPAVTPLSLHKKLFIERNTDKGKVLDPVKEGDELKAGDKVVVRIELRSDRDMDYLHLKDMRAASMEPVNVLSSYKWQDGLGYYESTKDVSTNFFISHLSKGTYVFDYPLFVTQTGIFSVGIATIQCMYAPEFTSHSEGIKIRVVNRTPNL